MENTNYGMELAGDGITFIPAMPDSKKALRGQWAAHMQKPQFTSREGLAGTIENLDSVDGRKVYLVNEEKGVASHVPGYKAIVSRLTGDTYAIRSERYVPVQDIQVARPVLEVANELELEVAGGVYGVGSGRTAGYLLLTNVKQVELGTMMNSKGHVFNDVAMLGVQFWNSYTGESSFGGKMFLVRKVCTNLLMMGDLLGSFKKAHVGELTGIEQGFKNLIGMGLSQVPELMDYIAKARETKVMLVDLPDLLWGISDTLPVTVIDDIVARPHALEATALPGADLTMWQTYNAVEAYISWKPDGVNNLATIDRMSEGALQLLTQDVDKLIEKGQARRKEYDEMLKDRQAKREAKKQAEAQRVLTGKQKFQDGEF